MSVLLSILATAFFIVLALVYVRLTYELPSIDALPALLSPPNGMLQQPTRIYDRSGEHILFTLEDPATAGHSYLPFSKNDSTDYERLPAVLVEATLAVADPNFWEHPGFVWEGISQGNHPTLAQRLVFDLLLWNEPPGLIRNLRERLLAMQATRRFGKEQVLEWYLNSAQYGSYIYGVDAASRAYLGKPASQVELSEAALLAAVSEAPAINPFATPEAVLERQQSVLHMMLKQGLLTEDEARQAMQARLDLKTPSPAQNMAPAFTNLVLEQLQHHLNRDYIERGGLIIKTTLNYDLQMQVSCVAQHQLESVQNVYTSSLGDEACQAARLLPTIPLDAGTILENQAVNVIVLDPKTGQILALEGNAESGFDPVHLPGHPPGTTITPFIYLSAFTKGSSPASLIWDIPTGPIEEGQTTDIQYKGPVSLREAFANDYLSPAVKTMAQIGPINVWRDLQQFGITSLKAADLENLLHSSPSFSEGGEITLLEISQAYGVFANSGIYTGQVMNSENVEEGPQRLDPVAVLSVQDISGKALLDCSSGLNCSLAQRPVVSPQLAYLVNHVMSDESARWPSLGHPNALEVGRPAGAKMAYAGKEDSAWAIGYTPQIVAGVWFGAPTQTGIFNKPVREGIVPRSAAAIWHAIVQYASKDLSAEGWSMPPGISQVEVCDPSGMLPTLYCPTTMNEVFLIENQPTEVDSLYRVFQINRETGRLATVFTPPSLIEEKVYLVVPPDALEWAKQAGIPMPPDTYDVIYAPQTQSPDATIHAPEMFGYASGEVEIRGVAGGEAFDFYRLQIGQGSNPKAWIQIGEDSYRPVNNGRLAVWDTTGLSGLYAVQLLVVKEDQRVEKVVIQVTVDNFPPDVEISQPSNDETLSLSSGSPLVFQARATDDIGLSSVAFYLDGKLLSTFAQPPFILAWEVKPGDHILKVHATDLAGNETEAKVSFSVK